MKIRMLTTYEAEIVERYDEEKDEVTESTEDTLNKGQILELEQIASEDGRTQFRLEDGSVTWLPDEFFETIEE